MRSAPAIKIFEEVWFADGIQENAGDEKTGEDEEEVDPCPSPVEPVARYRNPQAHVEGEDSEEGAGSQAIKGRIEGLDQLLPGRYQVAGHIESSRSGEAELQEAKTEFGNSR
jgi:hypothetical protein